VRASAADEAMEANYIAEANNGTIMHNTRRMAIAAAKIFLDFLLLNIRAPLS